MCPYARFQSAMFDKDTLIVSYDAARGEPRGARKRGTHPADARRLHRLPTVRAGLSDGHRHPQRPAIPVHRLRALRRRVRRRDAEGRLRTRAHPLYDRTTRCAVRPTQCAAAARDRLRGRVVVDGSAVRRRAVDRSLFGIDVIRDRGELFHVDRDAIRNDYTLKIVNKTQRPQTYALALADDAARTDIRRTAHGRRRRRRSRERAGQPRGRSRCNSTSPSLRRAVRTCAMRSSTATPQTNHFFGPAKS